MGRTIFFEEEFNREIRDFRSTDEIDQFLESESGLKLQVVKTPGNLVGRVGNVFEVKSFDINKEIDRILSKFSK